MLQNIDSKVTRSGIGMSHDAAGTSLVLPCVWRQLGKREVAITSFFGFNSLSACASLCL